MNTRGAVVAVAAVLTAAVPLRGDQIFRAGTDTVFLSITVADSSGRLIGGLDQDQFEILEDGVPQQIRVFSRDPQPIALSILLDTSTSMEPKLTTAMEAASGFAQRLTPRDVAQIVDFDSQVQILQGFTNDHTLLEAAIRQSGAGGSTSLYNAIYVALSEQRQFTAKTEEEVRRQAIVVLSDGDDTSSLVDYEQVLDLSKRSEVAVYAIGLRTPGEAERTGFNEAAYVLRTLSEETGGRVFFVEEVDALAGIYDQIALELANQYTVGYTSNNPKRDGAWRRIRVDVDAPGAIARTRAGYYGPRSDR